MTKEFPAGKQGMAPAHPGRIWRDIIKHGLAITLKEAAERMGVTRQQLHRILSDSEPHPVTPNMALRFARLCDKSEDDAKLWLRIQASYDLWLLKDEIKEELRAVRPITAQEQKRIAAAA